MKRFTEKALLAEILKRIDAITDPKELENFAKLYESTKKAAENFNPNAK